MKLRIWSWLAAFSVVSTLWFFYWSFIYETVVWNKPFIESVSANTFNVLMFCVSLALLFLSFQLKRSRFATIDLGRGLQNGASDWLSKKNSSKGRMFSFRREPQTASRSAPKRIIHVPGLRYMKRKVAWAVLILDAVIVLFTLSNSALLIVSLLFFLNGFYVLDYLYKTRKPTILEERKAEKEGEKI